MSDFPTTTVKPEEVYLVILCHYFVHPPESSSATGQAFSPQASSQRLALFLLRELKSRTSAWYTALHPLCIKLVDVLGELGAELVRQLDIILQGLQTPDDLVKLFDAFPSMLVSPRIASTAPAGRIAGISPSSPLGLFVRRVRASFLLLPAEGVADLLGQLQGALQVASNAAAGTFEGPQPSVHGGAPQQQPSSAVNAQGSLRDSASLDAFLAAQLATVQQQSERACTPELYDLLAHMDRIGTTAAANHSLDSGIRGPALGQTWEGPTRPVLPRALLLRLQLAMATKDYTAALDALHRYCDHVQAGIPQGPIALSEQPSALAAQARYQSALLSLASLHISFGHTEEAMAALNETLRMAQQNNDQWCLLHALAMLCRLLSSCAPGAPGLPPEDLASLKHGSQPVQLLRLLRRCLERGNELHCPHITAYAKLALTMFGLTHTVEASDLVAATNTLANGGSSCLTQPSGVLDSGLLEGMAGELGLGPDFAKAVGGGSGAGTGRAKGAGGGGGGDGGAGVVTLSSPSQAQRALRDVCLLAHMSVLEAAGLLPDFQARGAGVPVGGSGQLFSGPHVFLHPSTRPTAAASAVATQQLAGAAHLVQAGAWAKYGSSTLSHLHALVYLACYGSHSRLEDTAAAMAAVIEAIKTRQGTIAALAAAAIAERLLLPGCHHRPLLATISALHHDLALAHGCMPKADRAAVQLLGVADPCEHVDMDIRAEALQRQVWNLMETGALTEAHALSGRIFRTCGKAGMQGQAVTALLLIANVHRAALNYTGALPYLLSCLLHAAAANQDLVAAEALLLLGHAWLQLSPSFLVQVLSMVQDALPVIMAHGSLRLRAQTQWLLADMLASRCSRDQLIKRAPQLRALLKGALTSFQRLQCYERAAVAAFLLAHVHDATGAVKQRDQVASQFLELKQRAEKASWMTAFAA